MRHWAEVTLAGFGILLAGVGAILSGWAAMKAARRKRNGNGSSNGKA